MQWVAISGSWRKFNAQVEQDVRKTVREIIARGDGIVSGGSLGVDYLATDEALKNNPTADRIKVFLPATLEIYEKHCEDGVASGKYSKEQIKKLINQLATLRKLNPKALIEDKNTEVADKEAYQKRNDALIDAADALEAFQVNDSPGTQRAIDRAMTRGIAVNKREYIIE